MQDAKVGEREACDQANMWEIVIGLPYHFNIVPYHFNIELSVRSIALSTQARQSYIYIVVYVTLCHIE